PDASLPGFTRRKDNILAIGRDGRFAVNPRAANHSAIRQTRNLHSLRRRLLIRAKEFVNSDSDSCEHHAAENERDSNRRLMTLPLARAKLCAPARRRSCNLASA